MNPHIYALFLLMVCCLPVRAEEVCEELPAGGARVSSSLLGATGLPHHQQIEKLGERSFRILFNVGFAADSNYAGPSGDVNALYREKISKCLLEFNPQLKARDNDGNIWKVELAIGSGAEGLQTIQIGGAGIDPVARFRTRNFQRANSHAYPFDIRCETVVHELLHLGGLVDEYDENAGLRDDIYLEGHSSADRCRILGPRTSIMSNEVLALGPTVLFALQPAHVRALAYPDCSERNAVYFRCARFAYAGGDCKPPPECSLEGGWLR